MLQLLHTKSDDFYSSINNVSSDHYSNIKIALDIVKNFISDKKLILVGGMAIDYALRLKGESIYPEDNFPDYDFISPNYAQDAYELSTLLCEANIGDVNCKNAVHLTTLKIFVDYEGVADITYIPLHIFNKIPTLKYQSLICAHPHWQMVDQHEALSDPLKHHGHEVIFYRMKKDMIRHDLLYNHYPVVLNVQMKNNRFIRTERRDQFLLTNKSITIPLSFLKNACIGGWASVDYKLDDDSITITIPSTERITIISYDYKQFIKDNDLKVITYYSSFADKLPRYVVCSSPFENDIEIYDVFNSTISAHLLNKELNIWVCDTQWTMLYLMVKRFMGNETLVYTSEEYYLRCKEIVIDSDIMWLNVYGIINRSFSFLNNLKIDKSMIYGIRTQNIKPQQFMLNYPDCKITADFVMPLIYQYAIGEEEVDSFCDWQLEPYPEYTRQSLRNAVEVVTDTNNIPED